MRVAIGSLAKQILATLDIEIASHVAVLGGIKATIPEGATCSSHQRKTTISEVNMVDLEIEEQKSKH